MIRVVVADDHPIVRSGIVALLQDADDVEVVGQASDGRAAVTVALAERPDVVLMDLRMPVLDGDAATAEILAADPGVRILILTTYESDDQILAAIEAGATGYLLKAAPESEILAGVRATARGETALAPSAAAALVRRATGSLPAAAGPSLTPRELDVLRLVAQGNSNPAIGRALFLSEATVKTHLGHVFEKLGVNDRTRAVMWCSIEWNGLREANGSWNTICTCRRYMLPSTGVPSSSRTSIEPRVLVSSLASIRAMVDLPEPDSPTSATVRPGSRSNDTSSTARRVVRFRPLRVWKSLPRWLTVTLVIGPSPVLPGPRRPGCRSRVRRRPRRRCG